MPWKDGYTISDEKSLVDNAICWPGTAHSCLKIVVNLSLANGPRGVAASDLCTSEAYFTMNEGLESILRVLGRYQLKATFAVPAVIAAIYPEKIQRIHTLGHEIAAQGLEHEDVSQLNRSEENRRLTETVDILTDVMGSRPSGWFALPRPGDPFAVGTISESTMGLLIERDFLYMGNSLADDIPHYWVVDKHAKKQILALPYYYHFDDQFFMLFPSKGSGLENPDFLMRNWMCEFDAQHERGRLFEMTIHPKNSGWLHRLHELDRLFKHMRGTGDFWNPTSEECARYWLEAYPAASSLHLEDSIWQDHVGSLS